MAQSFGDAAFAVARIVQYYGPQMQRSCNEWMNQNISGQRCNNWALSVICGIGTIDAHVSGQAPVQDAAAPPSSVRIGRSKLAPRTLAFKARRRRRRSHDGKGDGDPEWDEGGFGGSCGNDSGGGGDNFWRRNWSGEGWWWEDAGDAALNLVYQIACWISLSQCMQFLLTKVFNLVENGVDEAAGDVGAFAQCSSVFVLRDPNKSLLVVDDGDKI